MNVFLLTMMLAQSFEVASVKPSNPDSTRSTFNFAPGELQIVGRTLRQIMDGAFDVRTFQILGGTGWVNTERFDISAKIDPAWKDLTKEQRGEKMRQALQMVLAERSRLKFTRTTRELPEYALMVAKGGAKIKDAEDGVGNGINTTCGSMKATRTTMGNLAFVLSRQVERPVVDQTGLTAKYNFELSHEPDGGCADPSSERPSLFTALQERLGLRLQAIKGPVDVIVINQWIPEVSEAERAQMRTQRPWRYDDGMQITVELPDIVADQLRSGTTDLPRRFLEAFAIDGYRSGDLTGKQVRELL